MSLLIRPVIAMIMLAAVSCATDAHGIRKVTDPNAPRSLPVDGQVDVRWTDPSEFSDIRYSGNRFEAERGNWVRDLAEYLRKRALKGLPPGERMEVEITDIRRAGYYEPWRGIAMQNVRILRDIYPPRLELNFRRLNPTGEIINAGERKLSDSAYLMRSSPLNSSDPLRYEKQMIDRWLRDELRAPSGADPSV